MEEEFIREELRKVEHQLSKLKSTAQGYKTSFIITVGGCIIYVVLSEVLPKMLVSGYPTYAIILMITAFIGAILLPMAYTPLNKFLKDATLKNLNYGLKRTFVLKKISEFNCNLEYQPFHGFDEKLLFRNGIFSEVNKGAVSDDLIGGDFNGYQVKMAEYHVGSFIKRNFDGYVAIIFDNKLPTFEYFDYEKMKRGSKGVVPTQILDITRKYNRLAFIKNTPTKYSYEGNKSSTLIIGITGNKTMLEYNFSKVEKNIHLYQTDMQVLDQLLQVIDELTKISSPLKQPHISQ